MNPTLAADLVREVVTRHISEALLVPIPQITPAARLFSDLKAESIDIVDIRFRIEEEWKIKIDQQAMLESLGANLSAEQLDARFTVGFIIEYVTPLVTAARGRA